jgi:hypothetical protein
MKWDRFFLPGIFSLMALVFGVIGWGMWLFRGENVARLETVRSIPERTLEEACLNGGPAWVRVRLECASSAQPLSCNGKACLWKARETTTRETKSVYRNGKWEKETVTKTTKSDIESVPLLLTAGSASLLINNWREFHLSADLLRGRGEKAPEADKTNAPQANQTDVYVPVGIEGWIMARFVQGKPAPVFGEEWALSCSGREGTVAELQDSIWLFALLGGLFGGFGGLFAVGAIWTILPSKSA